MSRRSDFFLAAVFVLSLLLLVGASYWDRYQKQLADQQFIIEHEEEAAALTQQFNANCPPEVQIQKDILLARGRLSKLDDPFAHNGALVKKTLLESLPQSWLSDDAIFYVFKFSPTDSKALTGEGLERNNSAFLARISHQLRDWQNLGIAERSKINNRLANVFGARVSGEILLSNRSGRFIDVVFNGRSRTILWDFLSFSGKQAGAFMIISGTRPSHEDAAYRILGEIAHSGRSRFFPMMIPLESLKDTLKPIVPVEYRSETPVLQVFSLLAKQTGYSQTASLSAGILYDSAFVFRAVMPRRLPYELWLTAERPDHYRVGVSTLYACLLVLFWVSTAIIRLKHGQPFNFSVKARLLGLILIVGGLPIVLLILAGRSVIEQDHHARYRAMIDEVRSELLEIDGNSTALRIIFESISRKYLADTEFIDAAAVPEADANSEIFKRCFDEFAANGVPIDCIGITYFGSNDQMIFPPGAKNSGDASRLYIFSPMMYAGLKSFSDEDHERAMQQLSESRKLGMEVYGSVTSTAVFSDLAMARQKSFLMSFGDAGHFIIYDFVADRGKIVAAVLFFAPAARAFARFARNAVLRGTKSAPDRLWALAEKRESNIGVVMAKDRSSPEHENWFLNKLSRALKTSSFQVETLDNTLAVCTPCENMHDIALGSTISLEPLLAKTARQYHLLLSAALILLVILVTVTSTLLSYFLRPLHIIESAITNILKRKFDLRLNLNRDDELGDVADAFDGMAQGLYERNELAQFVSGTLSNSLNVVDQLDKKPEKRWGVVLASDIRNFTTLSEIYPPEQIVELLNRHLELMSAHITGNHGEIDKFIGDAIIAVFFGDSREIACQRAVMAAKGMMTQHRQFVSERTDSGKFGYVMGIGIACGELLVGSFGAGDRHEYSLTGKARHLSEKLEAESKLGNFTHIVVSQEIKDLMPDLELAPLANSENFEVTKT